MQTITTKKQRIATSQGQIAIAESSGEGLPVLFVHGNSSCKEIFRPQLEGDIGGKYHCIAMDLPGHGESDDALDPEQAYTISAYAGVAMEVMQALGIARYAVFGWSLGGHIGIEMLARSASVEGLSISALGISGTPPVSKNPADMASAFLPSDDMAYTGQEVLSDKEANQYAHAICGSEDNYEDFMGAAVRRCDGRSRRIMMEAAIRGEGCDQRLTLESNSTPLLIINGAEEPLINNQYVSSINYKNLWQNQVQLIAKAGHAPFWEFPLEFNQLLDSFLSQTLAGSSEDHQ